MIILDNGHGKETPGKRSPEWNNGLQLFEWEFTRDIVKRISNELTLLKIPFVILVPELLDLSLTRRVKRANKIYQEYPDSILISIHGNSAAKPGEGTGWEVWTSPGQTESDIFASILYESAKSGLPQFKMRSDVSDGDVDKENPFTILSKTNCPAVLTENLFYDNENDCRFMMSDSGRQRIAQLHVEAIIKYLQQ